MGSKDDQGFLRELGVWGAFVVARESPHAVHGCREVCTFPHALKCTLLSENRDVASTTAHSAPLGFDPAIPSPHPRVTVDRRFPSVCMVKLATNYECARRSTIPCHRNMTD